MNRATSTTFEIPPFRDDAYIFPSLRSMRLLLLLSAASLLMSSIRIALSCCLDVSSYDLTSNVKTPASRDTHRAFITDTPSRRALPLSTEDR